MKNYTTVEQSKRLLELGLDIESADMWWNFYSVTTDDTTPQIIRIDAPWIGSFNWNNEPDNLPCWSTGALLEVIPKHIEEVKDHKLDLIFSKPEDKWCLTYFDWTGLQHGHYTTGNTQIEAVYNMVVWLLENGHLKK